MSVAIIDVRSWNYFHTAGAVRDYLVCLKEVRIDRHKNRNELTIFSIQMMMERDGNWV